MSYLQRLLELDPCCGCINLLVGTVVIAGIEVVSNHDRNFNVGTNRYVNFVILITYNIFRLHYIEYAKPETIEVSKSKP